MTSLQLHAGQVDLEFKKTQQQLVLFMSYEKLAEVSRLRDVAKDCLAEDYNLTVTSDVWHSLFPNTGPRISQKNVLPVWL